LDAVAPVIPLHPVKVPSVAIAMAMCRQEKTALLAWANETFDFNVFLSNRRNIYECFMKNNDSIPVPADLIKGSNAKTGPVSLELASEWLSAQRRKSNMGLVAPL
jgi:hypothetical protein